MTLFREEVLRRKVEPVQGTINLALPVSWQVIAVTLAGIIIAAGVFLATASYSRTEVASGSVVPESGILHVLPVRPGRVEAVNVSEGQAVRKGTILARIQVEETDRAGSGAQAAVLEALEAQGRGVAQQELLGRTASSFEQAEFDARIAGLTAEIGNLDAQMGVQQKLIEMAQSDLDQTTQIAVRGFISRRDVRNREEALLARQQQLAALRQARAAKVAAIAEADRQRRRATARASADVAGLATSRAQVEKERASTRSGQGYALVAPADGVVSAVSIHPGDAVTPERMAMMIVPAGGKLIARLYVPAKGAGFVRPGQEVRLALDPYPYERFGTVKARITAISSAPVERPQPQGASAPFYMVTAEIPSPAIPAYGRLEPLRPGMTFNARIVTEHRSLLQWLFDPLYAAAAGR